MLSGLFDEIDPRPLGLARVIVGIAALVRLSYTVPVLISLTDPTVLNVPYADWVPTPTPFLITAIALLWGVGAVLFIAGWRVSLSGTALLVAIVSTLALDEQTYANHLYLMSWLVLLLTLAGAGSGLNLRRTDSPVVRWPVLLLMAQVSIVYGFSALTKLNESFLSGTVLAGFMGTGVLPFPEGLRTPQILVPVAAAAVFVELFVAIFIWRERFRPAAFVLGFCLHLSIMLFMAGTLRLFVFALEMLALYPLFLPQARLGVKWDGSSATDSKLVRRLRRLDLLRLLEPVSSTSAGLTMDEDGGQQVSGFDAVERMLERVVPTLWVAPILRVPGIRGLGRRWYQRSRDERQPASG